SDPFLIWLWECKDKNKRKVDVGEVRELNSKLHEIGVSRAVGSLVTTIGFQPGAIDLAKRLGISLYLLKKKLVPHLNYELGAEETLREVIFAEQSLGFSVAAGADAFFTHSAKADFGYLINRMMQEPNPSDPWESI